MKQGRKYQKQTMGISLQPVIIAGKSFIPKDRHLVKESDIFAAENVMQNIERKNCQRKSKTHTAQGLRKNNARKELKREVFLTTTCETSTCKGSRVKYAVRQQKRITMITISR